MKKTTNANPIKDEKGIALLFTLGILAVLLVLALCFATTSITERKAASNNASLSLARMLAESGVQRAIAALRYYSASYPTAAYDIMYSHEESESETANNRTFDWLWKLETTQKGVTYYEWPKTTYVSTSPDALHWKYVKDGSGKIIGRFAYYVSASGGKLDPSACVTKSTDTGGAKNEDAITNPAQKDERPGKNVYEINIRNLTNSTTFLTNANVSDLSSISATPAGLKPDLTPWIDFDTMVGASGLNLTVEAQKEQFRSWFNVSNSYDDETFWIDGKASPLTAPNGLQESTEFYHRFNLARTQAQWDAMTVAGIMAAPTDTTTVPPAPGTNNDGTGIPWIANFGKLDDGTDDNANAIYTDTFPNVAARRNQIAANLIAYNHSPGLGLVVGKTTDSATDPTYTGNENAPYINEIGVWFTTTINVDTAGGSGKTKNNYDLALWVGCEIVNPSSVGGVQNFASTATVEILEGTFSYRWTSGDGTINSASYNLAEFSSTPPSLGPPNPISFPAIGTSDYSMQWLSKVFPQFGDSAWHNASAPASLSNVTVQIKRARLNYNGIAVDFVKPDYSGGTSTVININIPPAGVSNLNVTKAGIFSYQVDDPRQNLNDGDWPQAPSTVLDSPLPANPYASLGTPNLVNAGITCSNLAANTTKDWETAPSGISTAFVRNGPMQSPWELGFIHRGSKWETINLKKYSSVDTHLGVSYYIGARNYTDGDANILDQVKMTDATKVYGKVNLRALSIDSLRALLGYIRYGVPMPNADSSKPGSLSNGTELTYATHVTDMANAINGSPDRPFLTRAMVAKTGALFNFDGTGAIQNTDAKKEEIIGKFINLTKANIADEFTVICLAQTIKDVGSSGGSGITITKDLNGDGSVTGANFDGTASDPGYYWNGSAKTFAAALPGPGLVDESIANCKLGKYDLGADEILAEQKIMAVIRRNQSTLKWEIIKYEYADEN